MKILCLYNNECAVELFQWLKDEGNQIVLFSEPLDASWCRKEGFDLTVSYTYRHILSEEVITALNNNVVNLHNSILPFNRGADPNLWSIEEGTPRGVTLHYMDASLDQGSIIMQQIVLDGDNETLSSTYYHLDAVAKEMFRAAFKYYRYWPEMRKTALGQGTYHSLREGVKMRSKIVSYEMTVDAFKNTPQIRGGGYNALNKSGILCVSDFVGKRRIA